MYLHSPYLKLYCVARFNSKYYYNCGQIYNIKKNHQQHSTSACFDIYKSCRLAFCWKLPQWSISLPLYGYLCARMQYQHGKPLSSTLHFFVFVCYDPYGALEVSRQKQLTMCGMINQMTNVFAWLMTRLLMTHIRLYFNTSVFTVGP